MSNVILVIAPHPDDEVLGCGGTIFKHSSSGDSVHLCIVTKAYPPDWPETVIKEKRGEVNRASRILGVCQTHFLDLPTVKLDTLPQKQLIELITGIVNKIQPDIVYIPHKGDINKDHRLVFEAAMVSTRPKPSSAIKKVLCYEALSETEWAGPHAESAFIPNVLVDISNELDIKLKAMAEYKSELKKFPHPRSLKAITALAKVRGTTIGVKAAEAFMLIREIAL
jgi:LmbE family N-acetylglucosaminyl deacetylase